MLLSAFRKHQTLDLTSIRETFRRLTAPCSPALILNKIVKPPQSLKPSDRSKHHACYSQRKCA